MPHLLVIAHAPLASALRQVAEHTFPDCAPTLAVLDVQPGMCAGDVEAAARALMDSDKSAEEIARKAMGIAADLCVYTNHNVVVEKLDAS